MALPDIEKLSGGRLINLLGDREAPNALTRDPRKTCPCCGGSGYHAQPVDIMGIPFGLAISGCETCMSTGLVQYACAN